MHQKVMLVDSGVSAIGTANFDNRSFRLNFEITAIVADQEFAASVEKMLKKDFENAELQQTNTLDIYPYWFKLLVSFARLTSPML